MKNIKFLSVFWVVVFVISLLAAPTALALEDPETDSNEVILIDAATGNTLFSKNADEQAYPASLTKIMTVLLAVEAIERGDVSADDEVTCASNIGYDLIEDGSTANIQAGEVMTLKNLMYCALVASANEACNAIAAYISGNIPDFISLMNSRAEELGCTGTHFANTHGLPNTNHYTTAADMAKIAYEASQHELFMEICNTKTITIPATNMSGQRELSNTNGLINAESPLYPGYYYEYAVGMKTGHTDAAGYCLVSTAEKDGVDLLCVVMGGKELSQADGVKYSCFTDSINVYDWAFENFSYREVVKLTDLVAEVPVDKGKDATFVTVHPQEAIEVLTANDDDFTDYEQEITIYSEKSGVTLEAPVDADEVLGEIEILRDGVVYGSSKLVASSSIDLSYSKQIGGKILDTLKKPLVILFIIIVLGLIGLYIYLVARYRRSKKEYYKKHPHAAAKASPKERQRVSGTDGGKRRSSVPKEESKEKPAEDQAERDYFDEFFGKK